jgi:hypothetical protein
MKKGLTYRGDYEYASTRLVGTIVKLDNMFVHVYNVTGDGEVSYRPVEVMGDGLQEDYCHVDDLDLSPVRLGYINNVRTSQYIKRCPIRQYRQGLRVRNMRSRVPMDVNKAWDILVTNKYPSVTYCLDTLVNRESTSKAFHKFWSLGDARAPSEGSVRLYYKDKSVGCVKYDDKYKWMLDSSYEMFNEALEEVLDAK